MAEDELARDDAERLFLGAQDAFLELLAELQGRPDASRRANLSPHLNSLLDSAQVYVDNLKAYRPDAYRAMTNMDRRHLLELLEGGTPFSQAYDACLEDLPAMRIPLTDPNPHSHVASRRTISQRRMRAVERLVRFRVAFDQDPNLESIQRLLRDAEFLVKSEALTETTREKCQRLVQAAKAVVRREVEWQEVNLQSQECLLLVRFAGGQEDGLLTARRRLDGLTAELARAVELVGAWIRTQEVQKQELDSGDRSIVGDVKESSLLEERARFHADWSESHPEFNGRTPMHREAFLNAWNTSHLDDPQSAMKPFTDAVNYLKRKRTDAKTDPTD